MPLNIGADLKVSERLVSDSSDKSEERPIPDVVDFRMQAARRKSRMTQFISQVKEGDEHLNAASTDFEKAILKLQKRKRRRRRSSDFDKPKARGKLKLVWKENEEGYIFAKHPKTQLQELIAQRQTQKTQITIHRKKFYTPSKFSQFSFSRNETRDSKRMTMRAQRNGTSTTTRPTCTASIRPTKELPARELTGGTSGSEKSSFCRSLDPVLPNETTTCDTMPPQGPTSEYSIGTGHTLPKIDERQESVPLTSNASTPPATSRKEKIQQLRGRRYSRNLFVTKKTTGNEECYMYINRADVKQALRLRMAAETDSDNENIFQRLNTVKNRIERRVKHITKIVPELKEKFSSEALVKAFISEQFLDMHLQGPQSEKVRKLYHHSIVSQPTIATLIIKHPEILPTRIFKDLITYKKQFEVAPVYISTPFVAEKQPWRSFFNKSLANGGKTMLEEMEKEVPLYANFYKNLIKERAANTQCNPQLVKERRKPTIKEIITHITMQLRMCRHVPGTSARLDLMSVMATAGYNEVLLSMLALSVDDWLDQLVKCLGSNYKSVREETCQILCYMTTCYPLMRALYISKYFDVVHDIVNVLLKLMDTYEDSFDDYYIVLTHFMHHTPSRGALDCILDRLNTFKNVELVRRWPKLTYYAFKYWPDDPLGIKSPLYGKRVVRLLETALQKPMTQKFARAALYHFQVRYNNISRIFTVFSDKAEKAYLVALGFEA